MQDLLGKISQTILIIGTFSFLAAAVSLVIADVADGFTEKLVDIFFIIFGVLFLLSLASLPIVAIAYIWS